MIFVLFFAVSIMLLASIAIFKNDIIAPSCLLCGGFWFATICGCIYNSSWNFTNFKEFWLIAMGLICFIVGASFIQAYDNGKYTYRNCTIELTPIYITRGRLFIYFIWQLLILILMFLALIKNVGLSNGIAEAISIYYEANKTGDLVYSSGITNIMLILSTSGTFLLVFVMMHNIGCGCKNDILIYLNVSMGCISSLLNGTRTAFFMYAIACAIVFLGEKNIKSKWRGNIDFNTMVKIIIFIVALMVFFNIIAFYQGRTLTTMSVLDVFVTYLGAPLKNLELYISENHTSNSIFGGGTFYNTYTWIYEKTGVASFNVPKLNEYRFLNGKGLGNVYTIFLPLYSDFGIIGSSLVMGIIGGISQKIYDKVKNVVTCNETNFWLIVYSYVGFALLFSFFSNKYFEMVIARAMVYFVVGLWMFDLFFFRIRLKNSFAIEIKKLTKKRKTN
ncbi:MAG: oligosaccharide repeat unit polymerase [Lachnospiraceae bacterium]|nr:oligosaccharide repeat unit polymerase [Lachnospiraceae bacterium]